jgi:hypothetical protein
MGETAIRILPPATGPNGMNSDERSMKYVGGPEREHARL